MIILLLLSIPLIGILLVLHIISKTFTWLLNSPPKPHAFVSLPVQSRFFSFIFNFIKNKLKERTLWYVIFFSVVLLFGFRLPARLLLGSLDLLIYYPPFNVVFALCSVIAISNLKVNKVSKITLFFSGFLAFLMPILVSNAYVSEFFSSLAYFLAFIRELCTQKQYMGGGLKDIITHLASSALGPSTTTTGSASGGVSGSGGSGGGGQPPRKSPFADLTGRSGINTKWEKIEMFDASNNRIVNVPNVYTPNGPRDRQVGRAIADALDHRRNSGAGGHLSLNWFTQAQRGWIQQLLLHDHTVNPPMAGRRSLHQLFMNQSLSNSQDFRDLLRRA